MTQQTKIAHVLYPGLEDFPGHDLAKELMDGFGGILAIEVEGNGADASRVADRLKLFALAPSLRGTESLVTQPCTTTHHGLSAEDRTRRGITDAMLRLSVGLEDAEDNRGHRPSSSYVSVRDVRGRRDQRNTIVHRL